MMQVIFFILIALFAAASGIFMFRTLPQKWAIPLTVIFGLLALLLYLMLGAPKMI